MPRTLRRRIDLPPITGTGQLAKEDYEIDKHARRITGLLLTSDRDDMIYHRGQVSVTVNGEEVFPDAYHAKLLMSGLGVAPSLRYFPLDLPPGNGIVKVAYTDTDNPAIPFSPYLVSFYVQFQTDEDDR